MTDVAIVGAGLSGLVLARALSNQAAVTVFEKARGVGGRMATRRHCVDDSAWQFDHGAQFFTARSSEFKQFLLPLLDAGAIACWNARFAEIRRSQISRSWQWNVDSPHYVGTPAMNAVGKWLAEDLNVRLATTVSGIEKRGHCWLLKDNSGESLGAFDWVIFTAPASQTAALMPGSSLAASAEVAMLPCFALMLVLETPPAIDWQAARVLEADISWISVDSSKPGRPEHWCLVVHSTNAWAAANLEADPEEVEAHMLSELAAIPGLVQKSPQHVSLHRWRYANLHRRSSEPSMVDVEQKLAVCGDWLIHGRVEAAFLSAQRLLSQLTPILS